MDHKPVGLGQQLTDVTVFAAGLLRAQWGNNSSPDRSPPHSAAVPANTHPLPTAPSAPAPAYHSYPVFPGPEAGRVVSRRPTNFGAAVDPVPAEEVDLGGNEDVWTRVANHANGYFEAFSAQFEWIPGLNSVVALVDSLIGGAPEGSRPPVPVQPLPRTKAQPKVPAHQEAISKEISVFYSQKIQPLLLPLQPTPSEKSASSFLGRCLGESVAKQWTALTELPVIGSHVAEQPYRQLWLNLFERIGKKLTDGTDGKTLVALRSRLLNRTSNFLIHLLKLRNEPDLLAKLQENGQLSPAIILGIGVSAQRCHEAGYIERQMSIYVNRLLLVDSESLVGRSLAPIIVRQLTEQVINLLDEYTTTYDASGVISKKNCAKIDRLFWEIIKPLESAGTETKPAQGSAAAQNENGDHAVLTDPEREVLVSTIQACLTAAGKPGLAQLSDWTWVRGQIFPPIDKLLRSYFVQRPQDGQGLNWDFVQERLEIATGRKAQPEEPQLSDQEVEGRVAGHFAKSGSQLSGLLLRALDLAGAHKGMGMLHGLLRANPILLRSLVQLLLFDTLESLIVNPNPENDFVHVSDSAPK